MTRPKTEAEWAAQHSTEVHRVIVVVLAVFGVQLYDTQAEVLWRKWSQSKQATWLCMGETEDGGSVNEIVQAYRWHVGLQASRPSGVPEVPAGTGIALSLSDEQGRKRSSVQLAAMECELRQVAQRYGYDLDSWGAADTELAEACAAARATLKRVGILSRLRPDPATEVQATGQGGARACQGVDCWPNGRCSTCDPTGGAS